MPTVCLALGALTLMLLSFQLCDEVRAHISLLQGSTCGAGLQTWARRAPRAGSPRPSSFLETCRLLLPSHIQVVAVQLGGKGELERCPKGRHVVIREVENRTELKGSGFDCACLFSDCKQGPG